MININKVKMYSEEDIKKDNMSKCSVFKCLVDVLEKDTKEELSVKNKSDMINLVMGNKFNEEDSLDDYLYFKLVTNEKYFITYREDVFKRVNVLKKSGIEKIILFIFEDINNETRALVDFFSNKIDIKIVQINNVLKRNKDLDLIGDTGNSRLVRTNSKNNVFMINVSNNVIINGSLYTMSHYARMYYIMSIITGDLVISSNKEAKVLDRVSNKGINHYSIKFDNFEGCYYRESLEYDKPIQINSGDKIKVNNKIVEYRKKVKNKKNFKRSLKNV